MAKAFLIIYGEALQCQCQHRPKPLLLSMAIRSKFFSFSFDEYSGKSNREKQVKDVGNLDWEECKRLKNKGEGLVHLSVSGPLRCTMKVKLVIPCMGTRSLPVTNVRRFFFCSMVMSLCTISQNCLKQ